MVAQGITSFKVHLAYKDALGLTDEELFRSLGLARELGVMTMAHCENADAIELLRAQLLAEGQTGPEWHYHSRPPLLEADGTHHFLTFAALQEAPAYIAHLSCKESLDVALAAKQRGQSVWIETLIQFLLLDKTYAEKPDFEGAKYVMSPPLRDAANQAPLWDALEEGLISTLSTDHAPFDFKGQKEAGRNDFTRIPSGLPGIQDRATLLYTYGVEKNRIDIHRFVEAVSTQPAKLFGLYPRKGTIAEGSDADVVIFDPGTEQVISASEHAMNVDYNAFEGWPIKGKPVFVTVRGVPVVEEGSFVGHFGYGSFIKRSQPLI
jgi:dihydropyrimidinase